MAQWHSDGLAKNRARVQKIPSAAHSVATPEKLFIPLVHLVPETAQHLFLDQKRLHQDSKFFHLEACQRWMQIYGFGHPRAVCPRPGSAPDVYARTSFGLPFHIQSLLVQQDILTYVRA